MRNTLIDFILLCYAYIEYIYRYIKYIYICLFLYNIDFFERATISVFGEMGEWYVEEFWSRWNFAVFFYSTLWYLLTRKIKDKFESLKLEYIWKIKRSNHPVVKKIAEILSRYDWFNNNIIKF